MHANADNCTLELAHNNNHRLALPDRQHESPPIANLLKFTALPSLEQRMSSVFLGQKIAPVKWETSTLLMHLMSHCLDDFAASLGGAVVYRTHINNRDREYEIDAMFETATIDGITYRFMVNGLAFVDLPAGRFVASMSKTPAGGKEFDCQIEVRVPKGAPDLYNQWHDYARRNHYLVGRAAFADGEPIPHARRYSWDDVVVSEDVRGKLRTHIETFLSQSARLRAQGMKCRRGVLLAGPPGTGKTLLGKILADTLKTTFLWVLPRHVPRSSHVTQIVELARFMAPVVVLFEDLDLFGEDRETAHSDILGELMNQLDGVSDNDGIVTIATTNRIEAIEKALRNRPGRFDRAIKVGLPDETCRRRLLKKLLASAHVSDANLEKLVRATDGYSGAHLEEVVNTMRLLAAERSPDADNLQVAGALIDAAIADLSTESRRAIGFGHD